MLGKEEEAEAEVTKEDQAMINTFGRKNNRLHEIDSEIKWRLDEVNNIQDANNDILLADDDVPVKFRFGDVFANLSKEEAQAHLEKEEKRFNDEIAQLKTEMEQIKQTLSGLKVKLYGKFGRSINLEED